MLSALAQSTGMAFASTLYDSLGGLEDLLQMSRAFELLLGMTPDTAMRLPMIPRSSCMQTSRLPPRYLAAHCS